ncbi:hypothetical protein [Streptomyces sp. NPDC005009]
MAKEMNDEERWRWRKVNQRRGDMDFTPVRNGMDFLLSAFDHLRGEPDAREVKYAVLHLQAAVEVLLKARLIREHWSLVFSDPGKAKRADYEKGSFNSCTALGAVDRLNNIVNLQISKEQRQAISNLADTRNALTHLGHTASVFAVEAQAALVLDFLLNFIHRELLPTLSSEAGFVETAMDQLRVRLGEVESFVVQRSNRLEQELEPLNGRTVQCPACGQWAVALGESPLSCRFCMEEWETPHELAAWYAESGPGMPLYVCQGCRGYTVVRGASLAKDKRALVDLCFGCTSDYTGWRPCERGCDALVHPEGDRLVCRDCQFDEEVGF